MKSYKVQNRYGIQILQLPLLRIRKFRKILIFSFFVFKIYFNFKCVKQLLSFPFYYSIQNIVKRIQYKRTRILLVIYTRVESYMIEAFNIHPHFNCSVLQIKYLISNHLTHFRSWVLIHSYQYDLIYEHKKLTCKYQFTYEYYITY